MIAGVVKGYNLPLDYVLYEMSYANMIMYGAVIPSYNGGRRRGKGGRDEEVIKADDPRNRAKVRRLLDSFD